MPNASSIFIPSLPQISSIIANTPIFLTSQDMLNDRINRLKIAFRNFDCKIFYALKANYNPHVLNSLIKGGIDGVDCVSLMEIELAKYMGLTSSQINFTGKSLNKHDITAIAEHSIINNFGDINELKLYAQMYPNTEISLRIQSRKGQGECASVTTSGKNCEFGIAQELLPSVQSIIAEHQLRVVGLHCHAGSGLNDDDALTNNLRFLVQFITPFAQHLRFLDLGGGFSVRYNQQSKAMDIDQLAANMQPLWSEIQQQLGRSLQLLLEPGKYLVAESTCLLTKINSIKHCRDINYICVDSNMNHVIRPALYGSRHQAINLSQAQKNTTVMKANIVGNVCEPTDILGIDCMIANPQIGDVLAIVSVGAYCSAMGSIYNLHSWAQEAILSTNQEISIIRKSLQFENFINYFGYSEVIV